jgi:hypothetical protein
LQPYRKIIEYLATKAVETISSEEYYGMVPYLEEHVKPKKLYKKFALRVPVFELTGLCLQKNFLTILE